MGGRVVLALSYKVGALAMSETEGCLNLLSIQVCPAGVFKGIRFSARNPISTSF
jgi:hypothetical protein